MIPPGPADLRVRREALGLSQTDLARMVGVQDRAVRRWEAGERGIPDDVWTLLDDGERMADGILDGLVTAVDAMVAGIGEAPETVDVVVYPTDERLWSVHPGYAPWGAAWHRMVCARLRDLTEHQVRYVYGGE